MSAASHVGGVLRPFAPSPDTGRVGQPIVATCINGDTQVVAEITRLRTPFTLSVISLVTSRKFIMLHYAVVFFVIALIAALFGFGGIAASAVSIGKILFIVFAILAVASFLFGLIKKR
jgi:uncharacterized membrane protein YtjA (UPF0391 family)